MVLAALVAATGLGANVEQPQPVQKQDVEMVVLSGKLVSRDGGSQPVSNQPVQVLAWPSNEKLYHMELNEEFELTPIATVETSEDGTFAVSSSALGQTNLDAAADGNDFVNVSIQSVSPEGTFVHSTTLPVAAGTETGAMRSTTSPDQELEPVELGDIGPIDSNAPTSQAAIFSTAANEAMEAPEGGDVGEANPPAISWGFCSGRSYKRNPAKPVQVGGTFTHASGPTSTFQFRAESKASIGTATSTSTATSSFSAAGTTTVTNGQSITFAANKWGSRFHRVNVDSAMYKITCVTPDGIPYTSWNQLRPYGFPGGHSTADGKSFTTLSHCEPLDVRSRWEKVSSRSTDWSTGFKNSGIIGIDLSSQSGFTRESKMVINGGPSKTRFCGMYSKPNYSPGRIKVSSL